MILHLPQAHLWWWGWQKVYGIQTSHRHGSVWRRRQGQGFFLTRHAADAPLKGRAKFILLAGSCHSSNRAFGVNNISSLHIHWLDVRTLLGEVVLNCLAEQGTTGPKTHVLLFSHVFFLSYKAPGCVGKRKPSCCCWPLLDCSPSRKVTVKATKSSIVTQATRT